ncbi:uncharacterized protein LOC110449594 [Mizuhopecten yessoensis]|uniref:uncharacterized protein LOC110449594 n=1 Tax=Mizuhopecten yessoensis TaxID=6573 RepID=UPI000B45DCB7|nr:uncharacterized protein LOC110449594 [Mizuhopecten yessoensis]
MSESTTEQTQNGELQTLQTTVQTQTGELQTLQTTVQTQNIELQTLQTTVQTQNGELQTLQTTVQTQTGELQTLQTTIQTQNSELQTLQSTEQTQTGELQTLQTTIQTQNSELQTLQTTVQTQTSELQTQSAELQSLKTKELTENGELQTMKTMKLTQTGEMSSLKQQLSQANNEARSQNGKNTSIIQQLSQVGGGSTFVRWGRTDCPANLTELVHSGYAGGSWYDHTGAAVDYLCLPPDPEWLQTTVVPNAYTGRIYGAEYESNTGHFLFGPQSRDEEVPCAVCRSTSFVSSVMIPARTTCYSGWTKAYSGSLASGNYNNKAATQYVCVDENAQPLAGGADRDDNGILFLGVKAFCGSLRCPPYEQDKYIACVVCMK